MIGFQKNKNSKGITLVSLVITIVIMLILAAVSINLLLGDNGLINKTKTSKVQTMISKYKEDVQTKIAESTIDITDNESKTFCTYLKENLNTLEWVGNIVTDKEEDATSIASIIIVTSKDGYNFFIRVSNLEKKAEFLDDVNNEKCTITYDANGGEGQMDPQTSYKNFEVTLNENTFTNSNMAFVGWSLDKENGEVLLQNTKYKLINNITLYAQWKQKVTTIKFDPNGASGTIEDVKVGQGVQTKVPASTFINTDTQKHCLKWNTESDGTGTTYNVGDNVSFNEKEVTLYAMWENHSYYYASNADKATCTTDGIETCACGVHRTAIALGHTYESGRCIRGGLYNLASIVHDTTGSTPVYTSDYEIEKIWDGDINSFTNVAQAKNDIYLYFNNTYSIKSCWFSGTWSNSSSLTFTVDGLNSQGQWVRLGQYTCASTTKNFEQTMNLVAGMYKAVHININTPSSWAGLGEFRLNS